MQDIGFYTMYRLSDRYGPNHLEMKRKLSEMSQVIRAIIDNMDNETLLIVVGDHGMDDKGDHGGDSELEVTTAMLMYSKTQLTSPNHASYLKNNGLVEYQETKNFINWRTINQIDFTSTFSNLMGISIPFGNLGYIIPELFMNGNDSTSLLVHCESNTLQLLTFLKEYATRSLTSDIELNDTANEMQALLDHVNENEEDRISHIKKHISLSKVMLETLRRKWALFDSKLINYGIILMVLSTLSLLAHHLSDAPHVSNFNIKYLH